VEPSHVVFCVSSSLAMMGGIAVFFLLLANSTNLSYLSTIVLPCLMSVLLLTVYRFYHCVLLFYYLFVTNLLTTIGMCVWWGKGE